MSKSEFVAPFWKAYPDFFPVEGSLGKPPPGWDEHFRRWEKYLRSLPPEHAELYFDAYPVPERWSPLSKWRKR